MVATVSSRCHGRAPYSGERLVDLLGGAVSAAARPAGGRVGGQQVLQRKIVLGGDRRQAPRTAASRAAATGSLAAHSRAWGGPSLGRCMAGSSARHPGRRVQRLEPVGLVAPRLTSGEGGICRRAARPGVGCPASSLIAASGRILPGARSRRCGDLIPGVPQFGDIARPRRLRIRWMPEVRRHGSCRGSVGVPAPATRAANSSWAHSHFPASCSWAASHVAQLDQQLDVQRRVGQPFRRQRPGRPVRRRMLLQQPDAEQLLEHGAQGDPRIAEQPAGQLGVEQRPRAADPPRTGSEVLAGRVDDPLRIGDRRTERTEIGRTCAAGGSAGGPKAMGSIRWVPEPRPAELDQIGALAVAEAVGPLGVHRDRAGSGLQAGDRRVQLGGGADHRGTPSAGSVSKSTSWS